jgi:hypothetical protein
LKSSSWQALFTLRVKLERPSVRGVFRRHADGCKRTGRCKRPSVVRWKERGRGHTQIFARLDQAREFKAAIHAGTRTRRPLSSLSVGEYYGGWLDSYRGRTSRGLEGVDPPRVRLACAVEDGDLAAKPAIGVRYTGGSESG